MVAANKTPTSVRDVRLLTAFMYTAYVYLGFVVKVRYGGSAQNLIAQSESSAVLDIELSRCCCNSRCGFQRKVHESFPSSVARMLKKSRI